MNGEQAALVIVSVALSAAVLVMAGVVVFLAWKWPRADSSIVDRMIEAGSRSFNRGWEMRQEQAKRESAEPWRPGAGYAGPAVMGVDPARPGTERTVEQVMQGPEHTAGESAGIFK